MAKQGNEEVEDIEESEGTEEIADQDEGAGKPDPEEGDEGDEGDGDPEGDDEESDEGDDEGDEGLGQRANGRIRELVAKRKEAEAEVAKLQKDLEEARKLSGDDGKAMLAAAEASGILPSLMTKDESEAFGELDSMPKLIDHYETWLDDHDRGDNYEYGDGKELTYGEVKRRVRTLKADLEDLKDKYGKRRKELQAKVREIFELGQAAVKAGWKPGEKPTANRHLEQRPKPNGRKPARHGGADADEDFDVNNTDDLEAYIAASRRKKN